MDDFKYTEEATAEERLNEGLYRALIGRNADAMYGKTILRSRVSGFGLFFGGFYYLYRGVYREGIMFIAALVVAAVISITAAGLAPSPSAAKAALALPRIAFTVILGSLQLSLFYPAYDRLLKKRIVQFKQAHSYAGPDRMIFLAQQERTTHPLAAIIGLAVYVAVILVLAFGSTVLLSA